MPKYTWADFRADILCIDWDYYYDRKLLLCLLASFIVHLTLWQVFRVLPIEEQLNLTIGKIEVPNLIEIPDDFNDDIIPPRVVEAVDRTDLGDRGQPGAPGGGQSGPATAKGPGGNLVELLNRNQGLIELLTRDDPKGDWFEKIHGVNDLSNLPAGGVRIASRDGRQPLGGGDGPNAITTTVQNLLPNPGSVPLAEREIHKVISRVQPPEVATGDADIDRQIRHTLRARMPAVKNCYEQVLKLHGELSGTIVLRLQFGEAGDVQSAVVTRDTMGSAEVAACVARVLQGIRTPAPLGRTAEVQAPYVFTAVK